MEWLKARIQVNGVISLLAGLLVYGAVHMIGLTTNHEWATLGIILLTSMCFMAVVTADGPVMTMPDGVHTFPIHVLTL